MTYDEFKNEWLPYHVAKFEGIVGWMRKLAGVISDGKIGATRTDVMTSWHRTLARYSVEEAKTATDLMGGEEFPEPRGYYKHPLSIAHICKKLRGGSGKPSKRQQGPRVMSDGTESFTCPVCRDWGLVTIYHPKTVNQCRQAREIARRYVYTATARCSCNERHHKDLLQYDPKLDLIAPVDYATDEALTALIDWCSIERRMQDAEWNPDAWNPLLDLQPQSHGQAFLEPSDEVLD